MPQYVLDAFVGCHQKTVKGGKGNSKEKQRKEENEESNKIKDYNAQALSDSEDQ